LSDLTELAQEHEDRISDAWSKTFAQTGSADLAVVVIRVDHETVGVGCGPRATLIKTLGPDFDEFQRHMEQPASVVSNQPGPFHFWIIAIADQKCACWPVARLVMSKGGDC